MEDLNSKKSIDLARQVCDNVIETYTPEELPGIPDWFFYIQGVFLLGMQRCGKRCTVPAYRDYIQRWVDLYVEEDGSIPRQGPMLDCMMPAVLLIDLYQETGQEKYKIALDGTIEKLRHWPKNAYGGFYHKYQLTDQMWLDGLFMAGVLLTRYAEEFDQPTLFDEACRQAMLMHDHMRDPETGLYYHAWDTSKQASWANPQTGLSAVFWGRAMGWVAVALCDMLERIPCQHPGRAELQGMLQELLAAVIRYQDSRSGLWHQVIDRADDPRNWQETSCSCLFAYALHKSARLGLADQTYDDYAQKAYRGIADVLQIEDGKIVIPGICVGTNVSDYEAYLSRPSQENDNHGTGAFVLMCVEFDS